MKTLNEVIKAFEYIYENDPIAWTYGVDALHYLKEYRDVKNALDAEREKTIEAYCQWKDAKEKLEAQTSHTMWVDKHFQFEISDNPPLTWDDLKSMKDKPVWIEFFFEDGQPFTSDWFLVYSVSESFCDVAGKLGISRLVKNDYWQAYKKERK